ncbi:GFA family protein [Solirhodobacter olei]|uniref:GFA family protein n=1 Tax=Solirhodobacter olei TaxID=2493082 RepID=UPI000FD6F5CD|nr:GFA family protein [Solirhodobacter olei]
MANAQCSCGALTLSLDAPPEFTVACHCRACQRRTGAPFGVGVFYPAGAVTVSGEAGEYVRAGDSGGRVHNRFCPHCGSTVCWTADALPGLVGVAAGALMAADYPPPALSIFEHSMHGWVAVDCALRHFPGGSRPAPG